jgi:hypothetical protein
MKLKEFWNKLEKPVKLITILMVLDFAMGVIILWVFQGIA